jgi:hypothetical protein
MRAEACRLFAQQQLHHAGTVLSWLCPPLPSVEKVEQSEC